jgi:FkbM family methyltransferase
MLRLAPSNHIRKIRLSDGTSLVYRLNRGDMQSVREVFLDKAYRLPFPSQSEVLVDLGANIGTAAVWLAKRYGYSKVIAVEPSPKNAQLALTNLKENGINAELVEAAVGSEDGTTFFEEAEASNLGRVSGQGRPIRMISMKSILQLLPRGTVVDLKMDIEGGEEALLRGDLAWLRHVRSVIAEFHPDVIDYPGAVRVLQGAGFRYIAAGSAHRDSMDAFIRR